MKAVVVFAMALAAGAASLAQEQPDPKLTEVWEPVPPVVTPGEGALPPSDAVVLFDGKSLSQWQSVRGGEARWKVSDGCITVDTGKGDIQTKQGFGSCQLHIEFRCPAKVVGESQGRGNSGIFLQGQYELQVLDSYNNKTYSNGMVGSIYKQHIPLANAARKPGDWQTYDVVYAAPKFKGDGTVLSPAFVTVLHNGVLVLNHVEIKGGTAYRGQPKYAKHPDKAPLRLQDHRNPVGYRNIWIREL